ncbi:MAG: PEP/pyruvate-binding domain-containing protein [Patescibacteria group bacterium]
MKWIKLFSQISKNDTSVAGGKGASLGEMTQAGISVPSGFVILASAFEHFIEVVDLNIEISAILKTVQVENMETVERASEQIQTLILAKEIPEDIAREIEKSFKKLDAEFVAVRSSATAEDSASAAWAGQLDTFLNTTEEALLDNIRRCWASLFTPRAIFYRFQKGLHTSKISVAVVIQKMVQSEVSGIAFSVHPVTEDRNQMIIEAGFGLGEAIVSGKITPDSYVVTKEPKAILDKNISEQTRSLIRVDGGKSGNQWVNALEKTKKQKLSDTQILELSEIVLGIEKHYAFPVDIEWALENEKFFITQSRPITTLDTSESIIKVSDNRDLQLQDLFEQKIWTQNWSNTNMSLLFPSLYGRMYTKELSKYSGMKFTHHIVVCDKNVSSNFVPANEMNTICRTYAERIIEDENIVEHWCQELYERTDAALSLFTDLKKKKNYSIEDYRAVANAIYAHVPANFTLKRAADFLPSKIIEKYLDTFSKVRAYLEGVYPEADYLFRKIASHFFPELTEEEVFVLASNDIDALEKGVRPNKEILRERINGVAILFNENGESKFLTGERFQLLQRLLSQDDNGSELKGLSVFKGVVRGHVRVVLDPNETDFADGEILVTGMTRPDFLPLMQKAAAFVTDSGGLLSHAAITARELKKPCIVGTNIATKILKNGDMVEVDAGKGVIRKL